jgi:hypothetical protein
LRIVQVTEADGSYLAGDRDGDVGHHHGTDMADILSLTITPRSN